MKELAKSFRQLSSYLFIFFQKRSIVFGLKGMNSECAVVQLDSKSVDEQSCY